MGVFRYTQRKRFEVWPTCHLPTITSVSPNDLTCWVVTGTQGLLTATAIKIPYANAKFTQSSVPFVREEHHKGRINTTFLPDCITVVSHCKMRHCKDTCLLILRVASECQHNDTNIWGYLIYTNYKFQQIPPLWYIIIPSKVLLVYTKSQNQFVELCS